MIHLKLWSKFQKSSPGNFPVRAGTVKELKSCSEHTKFHAPAYEVIISYFDHWVIKLAGLKNIDSSHWKIISPLNEEIYSLQ